MVEHKQTRERERARVCESSVVFVVLSIARYQFARQLANPSIALLLPPDAIEEIEILIHGAHGGGVLTDRFSCTLNGDPAENLSPVYPVRGAVTTSVPDRSDQIYRIYARAPPGRCGGISTWQLIYQARDGSNFYQCLDVYVITAENGTHHHTRA